MKTQICRGQPASTVGLTLCLMTLAAPVLAQSEQSAPEPTADGVAQMTVLDPITVTARRREEAEIDAPISFSVIAGDDLPSFSFDSGADIARRTPNFNFVDFGEPGFSFGNIRGIGPLGTPLNSLDTTVGFSVNGVATSSQGFSPNLLDVDRVEVLRGPQGTLFGRNATGGVVNVITNPADGEREFRLSGQIGSDGYVLGEALAAGWLSPGLLAARGILRYQDFDGDIDNLVVGGDEGGAEITAGRGTLRLTLGDGWDVTLIGGYDRETRNDPRFLLRDRDDTPVSGADRMISGERRLIDTSLDISRTFSSFTLTSLTGFQDINLESIADNTDAFLFAEITGLPPEAFNSDPDSDFDFSDTHERVFSQEFRINSLEGAEIGWVAGVSYFRSEFDQFRETESDFFPTLNGSEDTEIDAQTFAVFGDASAPVPFVENLTVSGGLRVAHDEQDFRGSFESNGAPGLVPSFDQDGDFSDTYVTGRAALSYNWTDDVVSYVSAARGYSSGGFPRFQINAPFGQPESTFRPSTVWTYEAGIRSALLDRRVRLDASVFFNDVSDGQLTTFDTSTFTFIFANQDYRSYGFEVEGRAVVIPGLEVNGGVGFTETELTNVSEDAGTGIVEGNEVPNAPNLTANLGVNALYPAEELGLFGDIFANATYQFVGARQADTSNSFELDPYHLVDTQIGWESDHIRAFGFVRNAFDERPEFFGATFGAGVQGVIVGRGRIFGLGVSLTL